VNNSDHSPWIFKLDNKVFILDLAAEAFNKYYLSIVDESNMEHANIDSSISFLMNLFPDGFPEMINVPVTEAEKTWTVASLKCNNSSGWWWNIKQNTTIMWRVP
jgi:hypothetical protein